MYSVMTIANNTVIYLKVTKKVDLRFSHSRKKL